MRQAVFCASLFAATLYVFASSTAIAQSDIRTERVRFGRGATSAVIHGKITGREPVDYVLKAGKGLYMNVSMATDNGANYFNILAPGENEIAIFNGSSAENQYEGLLPKSGDYKIRVYMMRSAARRNEVANYRLEMIITAGVNKSPTAEASTPGTMMAQCRARAGEVMKTRLPDIKRNTRGSELTGRMQ